MANTSGFMKQKVGAYRFAIYPIDVISSSQFWVQFKEQQFEIIKWQKIDNFVNFVFTATR